MSSRASRILSVPLPSDRSDGHWETILLGPMTGNSWSTSKLLKWVFWGIISSNNSRNAGMSTHGRRCCNESSLRLSRRHMEHLIEGRLAVMTFRSAVSTKRAHGSFHDALVYFELPQRFPPPARARDLSLQSSLASCKHCSVASSPRPKRFHLKEKLLLCFEVCFGSLFIISALTLIILRSLFSFSNLVKFYARILKKSTQKNAIGDNAGQKQRIFLMVAFQPPLESFSNSRDYCRTIS